MCVSYRRKQPGCTIQPVYGFPPDETADDDEKFLPKYCAGHKKQGMISQKRSCCVVNRCYRRPSFGMPGEKGKYCSEHKASGASGVRLVGGVGSCCCFVFGYSFYFYGGG